MNNSISKNQVLSSLLWKFIERGGNQIISFVISIILARLLSPDDYGLIALIMVFITFANIFIQSGFSTSLIQKKSISKNDYDTAFTCSIIIASIIYIILFILAPSISLFYLNDKIIVLLRVVSLSLFIGSLNSVQVAIISRKMQFRKLFKSSIIAAVISGIISILLSLNNFGVWSLVCNLILNQLIVSMLLYYSIDWNPSFKISKDSLSQLFNFGSNILMTNILATLFLNLRNLVVGKLFNSTILGFYNRGMQFPAAFVSNIDGTIQSVMLPTYSFYQDNILVVRNIVRRSIKMSSFIVFPMMFGLLVISKPLILVLLTEKWIPAVIFVQIYCLIYALMPIHTANLYAIKALGHSGMILKIEIVKKVIDVIILILSLQFGVIAIALGELISGLISTIINAYPNKKYLNYSIREQWTDIIPSLTLSIIMAICIYFIQFLNIQNNAFLITMQILSGIVIYSALAFLLKFEEISYLDKTIKSFRKEIV